MSTIQGNLTSMARDVENAQNKSDRLNRKGSTAASRADTELEGAQSQWSAQAPYVFESLQALDESRLNHLRDVLTQFQTHEIDAIEKTRVSAESVLNILLNVETADEIKTYALRVASGDMVPRRSPEAASPCLLPLLWLLHRLLLITTTMAQVCALALVSALLECILNND